jgi:hypothetical protein
MKNANQCLGTLVKKIYNKISGLEIIVNMTYIKYSYQRFRRMILAICFRSNIPDTKLCENLHQGFVWLTLLIF